MMLDSGNVGNDTIWINETWNRIEKKMQKTAERSFQKLPYMAVDGIYDDKSKTDITWWTNGFWPAMLLLLYKDTGKMIYLDTARQGEELLAGAFEEYDGLHHDVGFMWHISSGMDYRLTGDKKSRLRALYAANVLAGRFNPAGGYIRAWNNPDSVIDQKGWAIIDCMMNLPLLYWASEECKDERFASIARLHADKTMEHHIRNDGSVRHIVEYDPANGSFVREYGGQGYGEGSSWSRGQAWGLYGFALSYMHTKKPEYLDTAKKIAHYFISCTYDDWLPRCDFRSPDVPVIRDSTAGMIAACGLLELSHCVCDTEKELYHKAAIRLLKAAEQTQCDWNEDSDGILGMGTERYHGIEGRHMSIIYGDYFLVEAIYKLRGNDSCSW